MVINLTTVYTTFAEKFGWKNRKSTYHLKINHECSPGGYSHIWTIRGWSAEQGMDFLVINRDLFLHTFRISWVSCHIQGIVFHWADKQYLEQGNSAFFDWLLTRPHIIRVINRVYKFRFFCHKQGHCCRIKVDHPNPNPGAVLHPPWNAPLWRRTPKGHLIFKCYFLSMP